MRRAEDRAVGAARPSRAPFLMRKSSDQFELLADLVDDRLAAKAALVAPGAPR